MSHSISEEKPERFYAVIFEGKRTVWKMNHEDFLAQLKAKLATPIGRAKRSQAEAMTELDKIPRREDGPRRRFQPPAA